MESESQKAKEIFVELLSDVSREQWDQHLDRVCEGDQRLRNRVRALLRAHEEPDSFLDQPVVAAPDPTIAQPIPEKPGTVIGPYKLLQKIGEGGGLALFIWRTRRSRSSGGWR